MPKSHVEELNEVYRALFQDALRAYPTLEAEFEKDLTRLMYLVEQRGIGVYLQDLPAVGKYLDRCLAGGQYGLSGLPLTKRFSGRVVIPKFLRGLYLLVFHEKGRLKEDYDVQAVFFLRQILFAAKKTPMACSQKKIAAEVAAFYNVDVSLPEPEKVWVTNPTEAQFQETYHGFSRSPYYGAKVGAIRDGLPGKGVRSGDIISLLGRLDTVSNRLTIALGSYDPDRWSFRHGPGAVSEAAGRPDKYHLLEDGWSEPLDKFFPISSCGYHNFREWAGSHSASRGAGGPFSGPQSRLVAVPKDFRKPRLIAAEPTAHQWCQQSCWHYFRERCRRTWIGKFVRFRDQTRNQDLCVIGSRDGSLCTVDLSAASDRVTCHAVGQLFRCNPRLLTSLAACRTPVLRQDLCTEVPDLIALRKFSTMGSAVTFPVQSLMFLSIALACVLTVRKLEPTLDNIRRLAREVSVFGDDIILPTECRELFFATLEVLDFKVNADKSFWTGKFRESCGVDAFGGVNVTPAYWKGANDGKPEALAMTVECSNNFYQKWLLCTSRHIASTVPRVVPMVPMASGAFGLKTRTKDLSNDLRGRWNKDLQRVEVRVGTMISVQHRLPLTNSASALLQYFTEAPSPYDMWVHGVPQKPLTKFRERWVAIDSLVVQANKPVE